MMPLMSRRAFVELGAPDLVYVRAVKAQDVLKDVEAVAKDAGARFEPDQTLYAVYGADGVRLAVLSAREEAFATAVAHELAPVSVH